MQGESSSRAAPAATFDLRNAREADYKNRRIFRYLFAAGGIAVFAEVVGRLSYSFLTHGPTSAPLLGALIGVPLAGVLLWVSTTFRPGASSVEIGAEGVRFRWRNGRILSYSWKDPKLRLTMWRLVPQAGPRIGPLSYLMVGGLDRRMVPLSDEASSAIQLEGRRVGLSISENPGSPYAQPKSVIVIRSPASGARRA